MTIGTGDTIVKLGTPKALETSFASIANNTMSAATTNTYDISADGSMAPDAEFVLSVAFTTAPAENSSIDLYAQELNIKGAGDEEAPETTFKPHYIASFPVNNVTTTQYIKALADDVPLLAAYYLHNNGTGQTISAGATLDVTPRTLGAA